MAANQSIEGERSKLELEKQELVLKEQLLEMKYQQQAVALQQRELEAQTREADLQQECRDSEIQMQTREAALQSKLVKYNEDMKQLLAIREQVQAAISAGFYWSNLSLNPPIATTRRQLQHRCQGCCFQKKKITPPNSFRILPEPPQPRRNRY